MSHDPQFEALRRRLRELLRAADGPVRVDAGDLRTVLEECGRLVQSNDRLRRQNRRLRLRLQRAGLADEEAPDGGEGIGPAATPS